MLANPSRWQNLESSMRTYRLSLPVRILVPALWVSSLPRNAIGFSFERGGSAAAIGTLLVLFSAILGGLLFPITSFVGFLVSFWVLGTAGALMLATATRPLAFVKPLCSGCRLLPVIREHEAIHLSGEASDAEIWKVMRTRHSCDSLQLKGDPNICWFCPIPKRLSEH